MEIVYYFSDREDALLMAATRYALTFTLNFSLRGAFSIWYD